MFDILINYLSIYLSQWTLKSSVKSVAAGRFQQITFEIGFSTNFKQVLSRRISLSWSQSKVEKKTWKTLYGRRKKGRGMGRKAQNRKGSGKGRREGRLSPQSPHSFPFSAQHPTTFGACYAGYHRRVYSSVKSLLAGAALASLTEVILFAFFRLGRHFSGMRAYWCIDLRSYQR